MKFIFAIVSLFTLIPSLNADEITHQIGNSGYAVREAMDAGAPTKSPAHYWNAVRLQKEAREKFKKRLLKDAIYLSKKAEKEAKIALEESQK